MSNDKSKKFQGRAYVLTFICMISSVILLFLIMNQPSGMAALYLIFPMGIVALLHIVLGAGAIISAVKAGNHFRNSWVYLYFISILLFVLIWSGFITSFQRSLFKKADTLQHKKEIALFQAIKEKDLTAVEKIIKSGGDLSHCFSYDRALKNFSPLQYSFYYGTPEINHALLKAGADPFFSCAPANSSIGEPIVLAVRGQDVESVIFILDKNPHLFRQNNKDQLLPIAVAGRRSQMPSPNPSRYDNKLKPDQAKTHQIVKLLLDAGAPMNDFYHHGTALHWAITSGDYELEELLLKAGADPNIQEHTSSYHNYSPLLTAIKYKHPELTRLLLNNTPPANTKGWAGYDALITAARLNDSQTTDFILQAGFNLKPLYDTKHPNPFHRGIGNDLYKAICKKNDSVVKALLAAGADINRPVAVSGGIRTITALVANDSELLKKVVALGGDVNAKDKYGSAPLHNLARCKSCIDPIPAMKNLLQLGADINILNRHQKTPLDIAINARLADTQQFLRSNGAKTTLQGS